MANEANPTDHSVKVAGHQTMSAHGQAMRTPARIQKRHQQYPLSIMGGHSAPNNAYCLFLMVNITLFLRPAELIPALANLPIYEVLILSSFFLSLDQIKRTLQVPMLKRQPITLCAIGILVAVVLSHASHMYLYGIRTSSIAFFKTLIYYILLVSVIDSPQRLKGLLKTVAITSSVMILLCVIDYSGLHDFEFIKHVSDRDGVSDAGDTIRVFRMRGTGIFQDPNDLSVLIVTTSILCLYFFNDPTASPLRFLWILGLMVLGIGLLYTRSRGGLLTLGIAGMVFVLPKYGKKAAILFALVGMAGVTVLAGRQGNIDLNSGTGHDRILLWREGLMALKSPDLFFGIGQGLYSDLAGLAAHNSYVHAFTELGLFGGTLYIGCFFFAGLGLYRLARFQCSNNGKPIFRNQELERYLPYAGAILAAWCGGMMSLSRCYVVPTYMIVGVSAAFLNLAAASLAKPTPVIYWNKQHLIRLTGVSFGLFIAFFIFVRLFAH
ncbi:MAG: O-antigen ligase family protein [Planctomycetes bacterium]|nr:O-antigen ligase family protein [Planctomycetota bacterium]MCH9724145.1 O-antigen ligase family protein [Planctomycetota bacterium]MCH9778042.1 O-antigen ligase family protein [Planctomycetota bacterium]